MHPPTSSLSHDFSAGTSPTPRSAARAMREAALLQQMVGVVPAASTLPSLLRAALGGRRAVVVQRGRVVEKGGKKGSGRHVARNKMAMHLCTQASCLCLRVCASMLM